jgi:hypothetical protein
MDPNNRSKLHCKLLSHNSEFTPLTKFSQKLAFDVPAIVMEEKGDNNYEMLSGMDTGNSSDLHQQCHL